MPTTRTTRPELDALLAHAHGADTVYEHWTQRLLYTEGVKHMADAAGAYWLVDAIASHRRNPATNPARAPFQLWTLSPTADGRGATLTMREDSGGEILVCQLIEFTDFPLHLENSKPAPFTLYLESNGPSLAPTLLLPSEH